MRLKLKQLFNLMLMLKISINTTSKNVKWSLKRLILNFIKVIEMKNLSFKLKKQGQLSLIFKRPKYIKLKKKKKIVKIAIGNETNGLKNALFLLQKSIL